MTTKAAAISDEARRLLEQLTAAGVRVPRRESLADYRAEVRAGFEPYVRAALDAFDGRIEPIEVDDIPCLQLTPDGWSAEDGAVVQYAYGGGYISGSAYEDQIIAAPLARQARARVVMVEYRRSPEHPYPAAQQDMHRVYPGLVQAYGADRLIVAGESAGGNQALGLLQHLRAQALPLPRCAALFSPWCDLANRGDSHLANDDRDPTLNNAWVDLAAELHAAGRALDDPGLSPIYGDMQGLPPTIITSGSRDLLLSQCLRLAQRLRAAGVECDLRVWEGLWHVFEFYPIPEAHQSITEVAEFVRTHCSAAISRLTR